MMKKNMIRVLSLILALTVSLGMTFAFASAFSDVPDGSWYAAAVQTCVDNSIVSGTSATTFSPNANVTRAQFLTMLYNASMQAQYKSEVFNKTLDNPDIHSAKDYMADNKKALLDGYSDLTYSDVSLTSYYAAPVIWAQMWQIASGVGNSKFAPDAAITREQMMTMLKRYSSVFGMDEVYGTDSSNYTEGAKEAADYAAKFGISSYTKPVVIDTATLDKYADGQKVDSYAKDGVCWAIQCGYVSGITATTIEPLGTTTRAQATVIIARMLNDIQLAQYIILYEDTTGGE